MNLPRFASPKHAARLWLILSLVPGIPAAEDDRVFNVRHFGARGDGATLETAALNAALEACASTGGGEVRIPPGRYLSGTIRLKSRVHLVFESGAMLIGATNLNLYESFAPPPGTPEAKFGARWHRALILADGAEHISLTGDGRINGNKVFDPRGEEHMRGPHTILFGNCRDVVLRDIAIEDSANYAVLLENCQAVQARGLRITGGWDGIHFRGWPGRPCRDVTIAGCEFYTGDDSIAGRYWESVLIDHCIINSSCNGIRLIGPAEHLAIHDCMFFGPGKFPHRTSNRHNMLAGINLQPGAWDPTEGKLDDVLISDCTMDKVAAAFHFLLKGNNTAGRISVNRVSATRVYRAASSVESWTSGRFADVVFRDVTIESDGGGRLDGAEKEVKSPGVDARPLPAWGFYARHLDQLTLDNVRFRAVQPDLRHVMICEDVAQLNLLGLHFPRLPRAAEPVALKNVTQVQHGD